MSYFKFFNIIFFTFFIYSTLAQDSKTETQWVKDADNDEVMVLDQELRQKLSAAIDQKATTVYDNEKSPQVLKKVVVKEVVQGPPKITYIVVEGDTLQSISKKLYGTTERWREIFLLNEGSLSGENVEVGMKLICNQK